MDRLKLIEVIAETLDLFDEIDLYPEPRRVVRLPLDAAGQIADAIIRSGALRSLRTPERDPEGGTMPPGPWSGSA